MTSLIRKKQSGQAWETIADSVTVDISSDQIKSFFSDPPVIVPAPGPDLMILMLWSVNQFFPGVNAYANDGFGEDYILGDLANLVQIGQPGWDLTSLTSPQFTIVPVTSGPGSIDPSWAVNQPLRLANETSDPTDGDGTARVTVYFAVVEAPV